MNQDRSNGGSGGTLRLRGARAGRTLSPCLLVLALVLSLPTSPIA
jgi:hypothetical protein